MFTMASDNKVMLLLVLLMYAACRPGADPVPFYPIPEDAKHYVVFPEGSYWVYEEGNTLAVDTVRLYRSEVTKEDASSNLGYNYERLSVGFRSSLSGDSTRGSGKPFWSDPSLWSYEEFISPNLSNNFALVFLDPTVVGEVHRYAEDWAITLESESQSMKVAGVTYASVKVFKHNVMVFPNQSERVYFSKDVGIVKRELFNGEVWQLKTHFINN